MRLETNSRNSLSHSLLASENLHFLPVFRKIARSKKKSPSEIP